jgi:hypothetical protein
MNSSTLSVREIEKQDIDSLVRYWLHSDSALMVGMGVDLAKMPPEKDLRKTLSQQLSQPYEEKQSYCIIWLLDGKPVGHSNINKIIFGEEASMHLHLWNHDVRKKGMGTGKAGFDFVKEYITVPGWLNFEQPVKRWELSLEKFEKMNLLS